MITKEELDRDMIDWLDDLNRRREPVKLQPPGKIETEIIHLTAENAGNFRGKLPDRILNLVDPNSNAAPTQGDNHI